MSDDTTPPSDGMLPLAPVTMDPPRRRVLWGVLTIIAVVTGGVVVASGGDSSPKRLPVALGSPATAESGGSGAADMKMARVHYVAGDGLPELGGEATAYRLDSEIDDAKVRVLADALGVSAAPTRDGERWRVEADGDVLEVLASGGSWWFMAKQAQLSSAVGSSGSGECAPDGTCTTSDTCDPEPCTTPAPQPPTNPDLPSEEQARQIALDLLASTGIDVVNASVIVDGPYEAWYVSVEPRVAGVPVSGAGASVGVGAKGTILNASGTLGTPAELDAYPLVGTTAAIDRLNAQQAALGAGPMPDDARDVGTGGGGPTSEPVPSSAIEITLVAAEPILLLMPAMDAGGAGYLVPGYRMTDTSGGMVDVVAVEDDSLVPTHSSVPDLVDPSEPDDQGPIVLPPDGTPEIGVAYYVDVDVACRAFELGGETWRLEKGDLDGWSAPHEGGTFTLDTPDHGTFVGDYEGNKTATFVLGTDEQGCTPTPRG